MYGSPMGSLSGIVHMVAKRPYIATALAAVAVTASVATAPVPDPPAIPILTPSVIELPTTVVVRQAEQQCAPAVTPAPDKRQLGICTFASNRANCNVKAGSPTKVTNVCKAMLDNAALALKHDPTAMLLLIGNANPSEVKSLALARAANVKAYFTRSEAKLGIDSNRIEVVGGTAGTRTVELWLVPADSPVVSSIRRKRGQDPCQKNRQERRMSVYKALLAVGEDAF